MKCVFPLFAEFRFATWVVMVAALSLAVTSHAAAQYPATPSAAERLANEQVSLSADKILEVMKTEPGLLLEFKKTLVRKAYEQGRYLDPQDLTDEAVFALIKNEISVRVLATREMESRGYIRALPNRQELEQVQTRRVQSAGALSADKLKNQEQAFWATHEVVGSRQGQAPQAPEMQVQPPNQQEQPATPASPPQTVPDQRRQVQQADADIPDALYGTASSSMAKISPSELPGVLGSSAILPASQRSNAVGATAGGIETPSGSPSGIDSAPYPAFGPSGPDIAGSTEPSTPATPRVVPVRRPPSRTESSLVSHRPNPYADVPSLYDLYTQVSKNPPAPRRFGTDIFVNGTSNLDQLPMDLPAGPEYVLGPGDGLTINLWGSVSQRLQRTVDREGRLALPEVGTLMVAGRTLGDVQREAQNALRTQLRSVQVDIALSRLRTVRVYVVGDVSKPGPYDIVSLSTPLNALITAGGPTARGSFRTIKHYRGQQLVQTVDVYDLILHGIRSDIRPLESGDTILVPPMGPQVTVTGMVRRPAIYELNGAATLADVLELAGGVLSSGTLRHIDIERLKAHEGLTMVNLQLPETNDREAVLKSMEDFKVQDGDKIRISPVLPYSHQTVYLDGHVFHPGKYPYLDGMKLTDLVKSYADLMPEPAQNHAEIIRLEPPDFRPTVLAFNLGEVMSGKGNVPELKPFDTVRIFGRYDFEDPPEIFVSGEVRNPGELLTNGQTRVRDAVYLAGGITPDAKLEDVQIYRHDPGGNMQVFSVNLGKALSGDSSANIVLQPRDRIIVQRNLTKYDPPTVTVAGEVARPGRYPLAENMTATDLVALAGGFRRSAYTKSADLSRYVVQNGSKVLGEHQEIAIAKAISGEPDANVRLVDGDVLSIRKVAGWNEVSASVSLDGEVVHPSVYGIRDGEKLSSVLRRAGGFRAQAYVFGAVLERVQVREFAEQNRQELIRRIEGGENFKFKAEDAGLVGTALQQQQQVLTALKNQTPSGRLVIHISKDIDRWANTSADVELRAGDTIYIPKRPTFVMVTGQVYNSSALSFAPGKSAGWYLSQAGGPTNLADKGNIFVIRADGSVIGRGNNGSGLWHGSVTSARLEPGDTVVVPQKFVGTSAWKSLMSVAQFASSVAFTAAVALK